MTYCGHITIVGRPNVGKSTLLNKILGQKLSITSRKPQTTRRHLLGIKTSGQYQSVFIDTPGLQTKYADAMNRAIYQEILNVLDGIDVILFLVESLKWNEADIQVLNLIKDKKIPVLLVINKIDKARDKSKLLPFIARMKELDAFSEIIPLSAKTGERLEDLEKTIHGLLPAGPFQYDEDDITDRSEQFFAAEFIREKLTRKLGDELPYCLTVTIERFFKRKETKHIHAIIWVENQNQKSIVIGTNGTVLKSVGEQARKDMETLFGSKVYLNTWVKVKKNWTSNVEALKQFGFES